MFYIQLHIFFEGLKFGKCNPKCNPKLYKNVTLKCNPYCNPKPK